MNCIDKKCSYNVGNPEKVKLNSKKVENSNNHASNSNKNKFNNLLMTGNSTTPYSNFK